MEPISPTPDPRSDVVEARRRVLAAVASWREAGRDAARDELGAALAQLAGALSRLFAEEEDEVHSPMLTGQQPQVALEAYRLVKEHRELSAECERLAQTARLRDPGPLDAAVVAFIARLAEHDRAENHLFFESYWHDSGPVD